MFSLWGSAAETFPAAAPGNGSNPLFWRMECWVGEWRGWGAWPRPPVCACLCVCARTCDNFAHFSVEAESKCQQYEVASSLICPSHPSHISSPSSLPCFLSFSFLSPVNLLHHWADEEKVTQLCPNYSITFVFLVAFSFSHSMPKLNRTIPAIALWWWARVHLIILVK